MWCAVVLICWMCSCFWLVVSWHPHLVCRISRTTYSQDVLLDMDSSFLMRNTSWVYMCFTHCTYAHVFIFYPMSKSSTILFWLNFFRLNFVSCPLTVCRKNISVWMWLWSNRSRFFQMQTQPFIRYVWCVATVISSVLGFWRLVEKSKKDCLVIKISLDSAWFHQVFFLGFFILIYPGWPHYRQECSTSFCLR